MPGQRIKKYVKNLAALGIGLLGAFLIAEIFLRIYNPFVVRIKGDRIILPVNQEYILPNPGYPQLDDTAYHSKNSLGFRGPEKPANFDSALTIIAIGGSTTECTALSDGFDWPTELGRILKKTFPNSWVTNAGLTGHSTYGHQILMEDYIIKMKPDYVLFLTGANDIKRSDLTWQDALVLHNRRINWKGWIVNHSEVLALLQNLWLARKVPEHWIGSKRPRGVQLTDTASFSEEEIRAAKQSHLPYLAPYRRRLLHLMQISKTAGIAPVFCTQPMLWGDVTDPKTGRNLGNIESDGLPTGIIWEIWEMYNDQVRSVCKEMNIPCIDLAAKMPKNSLYYYDEMHFTNEGAGEVAKLIARDMRELLKAGTQQ